MNYSMIIAGLVFLFNPNINIIDVLPDFIGYLLIFCGLYKISFTVGILAECRTAFGKLIALGIAKFLCIGYITKSDDTLMLVLTFSFAVIEFIMLIPAFNKLFDGIASSATRYNSTSVVNGAGTLKAQTFTFIIIRAVTAVLPELTSLSMFDNLGYVRANSVDIYEYKPVFIIIAVAISTVSGVFWLVKSIKYFNKLNRDSSYNDAIRNEFTTRILPDKNLFTRRSMRLFCIIFIIFGITSADIFLDDINYLPDFIAAVFLFIAACILYKYGKKNKLTIILPVVYFVISAGCWAFDLYFDLTFGTAEVRWVAEAEAVYQYVIYASVADAVAFVSAAVAVLYTLSQSLPDHIEQLTGAELHDRTRADALTREFISNASVWINIILGATVVNAVMSVVYFVAVIETEIIWLAALTVAVVYLLMIIRFAMLLLDELYNEK